MYEFFTAIHLYSIYTTVCLMLLYLVLTQRAIKTEFDFIRSIRIFLPLYYTFLAIIFFTGSLLLALRAFYLDASNYLMIAAWILILGLNIFQFKLFKKARTLRRYTVFKIASLLILCVDLGLIFAVFLYVYGI